MEFKHYCPYCGAEIETEYEIIDYTFKTCKQNILYKDLVPNWTLEARINQLRAMNILICNCNDENIYGRWIYLMPDEATEEDFFDMALSEKNYNECFDLFLKLVAKSGMRW